ncbi:NUDIX hydrolase [Herbiconiux sp. SYSU D00978]|uniref:NUDIX hydrolase n=1 Tax=Herbiconiux sp. SYSU D00978 TaxID=2812562 RepID=UPI001A964A1D|nr:NUDIX domain-containing protein [Herbiconiux sp. SYSU D00978]
MTVRRTARILLLDEEDHLLLLKTHWDKHLLPERWLTPGGGIDPGESEHDAAVRELFEETGLRVEALGDPVARTRIRMPEGHEYDWREAVYYLLRTTRFQLSRADWTESEVDDIVDVRWFSPEELAASTEEFDPEDVRGILAQVVPGR